MSECIPKPRSSDLRWLSAALGAALLFGAGARAEQTGSLPVLEGIGADFSAPSSLGRDIRLSDYRGKVVLLFFGYTTCQDVCPVTLSHLKSLVEKLGEASEEVQVLLVTVDPEIDSPEHLRSYLARFDSRFVGVSGDAEQLSHIAHLFGAQHSSEHGTDVTTEHNRSRAFADRAHLYSHSQQIYLLDKVGRARALFFNGSPLAEMQSAVTALLNEPKPARIEKDTNAHAH